MGTQPAGIQLAVSAFEVAGVATLVIGALVALALFAAALLAHGTARAAYRLLRTGLGLGILLGLEFLVAADIIRSVAIQPSLLSVGTLGLLVLVRTFLSWALEVEIEGRWPWQRARSTPSTAGGDGQSSA